MKKFNSNYIAVFIVSVAFLFSAVRFCAVSSELGSSERRSLSDGEVENGIVVSLAHWQLEPGFREGLDWAMSEYEKLPHVRDANVSIKQIPIPDKVYNQFMNVQLIAGTATDIAQYGQTQLIKGNNAAKFYAPFDEYASEPNPYNSEALLPDDLAEEQKDFLRTTSWKNTFVDGMESTYEDALDGYFAVRIGNFGQTRLFFNETLLDRVKEFALEAARSQPQPDWLRSCWLRETAEGEAGYLRDTDEVRAWLANDEPPRTLGRLLLFCEAVEAYADANGLDYLVPISGSSYGPSDLTHYYERVFAAALREKLDKDEEIGVSVMESLAAFEDGVWNFESEAIKEYFVFARIYAGFFPTGYLGLDREQAMRRFALGNAAILSAGAWDVGSLIHSLEDRDNPEDVFDIAIAAPPIPAPGERWSDLIDARISEMSETLPGVGFALNKSSPHFKWALDFLRFATSLRVNEKINEFTGWLPSVVGAEPSDRLKAFVPIVEGYPPGWAFSLSSAKASIKNLFTGQKKLLLSGETDYDSFTEEVERSLSDQRMGIPSHWFREWQSMADRYRAVDRTLSVERFQILFGDEAGQNEAARRERALFNRVLLFDEGLAIRQAWKRHHPGKPFPEY